MKHRPVKTIWTRKTAGFAFLVEVFFNATSKRLSQKKRSRHLLFWSQVWMYSGCCGQIVAFACIWYCAFRISCQRLFGSHCGWRRLNIHTHVLPASTVKACVFFFQCSMIVKPVPRVSEFVSSIVVAFGASVSLRWVVHEVFWRAWRMEREWRPINYYLIRMLLDFCEAKRSLSQVYLSCLACAERKVGIHINICVEREMLFRVDGFNKFS